MVRQAWLDARAVGALLRGAFGRDVQVRHATSLLRARNMLLERVPELIILDDILPPRDRAETSIAALREARFAGSIVVVSGGLTRIRTQALRAAGATGVIHKDDLNTTELAAAVYGVSAQPASGSSEQSRIKTLGEIDDELN